MIEKQMEQQKYMFEEAHRQKEFLEQMFGDLLMEQRNDIRELFAKQAYQFEQLSDKVRQTSEITKDRIESLESIFHDRLVRLEAEMKIQKNNP